VDVVLALTDDSTSAMRAAAEAVYARVPLVISDLRHLAELFPGGVRVSNDAESIASGVRAALATRDQLTEQSTRMRDGQLGRWHEQRSVLLDRLGLTR
jgi:hypothetical protein